MESPLKTAIELTAEKEDSEAARERVVQTLEWNSRRLYTDQENGYDYADNKV